jgi:hypothetical protein
MPCNPRPTLTFTCIQVFKGIWQGQAVAIKVMNVQGSILAPRDKSIKEYNSEVRAFIHLPAHPNLLQLLGVSRTEGKLAMVTQ